VNRVVNTVVNQGMRMATASASGPATSSVGQDKVAAFRHEGAMHVPGMLSREEVAAVRAAWSAFCQTGRALTLPDARGRPVELILARPSRSGPLAALTAHPRLVGTAAALLGEPVELHQVVASPKPPGAGRVEWHQEYRSLRAHGLQRPDALLVMVLLDPAPPAAGCLQIAVGSHRLGLLPHRLRGGQEVTDEAQLADRPRRSLPARPGDALLFQALTAHASDPNTTTRPRRAVVVCYRAASNLSTRPARPAQG